MRKGRSGSIPFMNWGNRGWKRRGSLKIPGSFGWQGKRYEDEDGGIGGLEQYRHYQLNGRDMADGPGWRCGSS